ncbi:MAG TPA: cytochrome c biogenesis protein CcdA [Armatimonadota bacterium]|jgi:thiol:disulfide interchange protein DsbD
MKRILTAVIGLATVPLSLAQGPPPDSATLVAVRASVPAIKAGAVGQATVTLKISPGWHVNSNKPSEDYLRPTVVALKGEKGITPGKPTYPAAEMLTLTFSDKPLSVFQGEVPVMVPLSVNADAPGGTVTLKGIVDFQPCNATSCFAPATKPFTLLVKVLPGRKPVPPKKAVPPKPASVSPPTSAGPVQPAPRPPVMPPTSPATGPGLAGPPAPAAVKPAPTAVRPAPAPVKPAATPTAVSALPAAPPAPPVDPWSNALQKRGLPVFLVLIFFAGLALNLTPCVYPMIAVTMSVFGARAGEPRAKLLGKAIVYVLGMATMYTTLGLFAALTGALFGGVLQSVWVQVGIAVFLFAMALGMFGLFTLQLPPSVANRLGGSNRTGMAGLFVSGLVVGLFAAPCVGPVVLGLIALVGARHDAAFGAVSFFTLALGLGVPYVVLALFTGLLGKLPRSGGWMETVKHFFGVILMAVAARYLVLAFAREWADFVTPLALVLGGDYLGFAESHGGESMRFVNNKRALGVIAVALGVFLAATAWNGTHGLPAVEEARWTIYSDAAFADARAAQRPIVMDFGASWCAACKELEEKTFPDPAVADALKPFTRLRVELDGANRAEEAVLRAKWGVKGLPDVVFLDSAGRIVPAARIGGFLPPKDFMNRVAAAKAADSATP